MQKKKKKQVKKPAAKKPIKPWSRFEEEEQKDDKFWDKKAFKQCLWQYFIKIKKGKPLTAKDYEKVWREFNLIGTDAEKRFKKIKPVKLAAPEVQPGIPKTSMDYLKKFEDGMIRRKLKSIAARQKYIAKVAGKEAALNYLNMVKRGGTQREAQILMAIILRGEAERK